MNGRDMIAKTSALVKQHQHGLFIGLCLILTAGIGYNIGRIVAMHAPTLADAQTADLYNTQQAATGATKTGPAIKVTQPSVKPSDPRVVASKASSSKLYHHPWCSGAQRIKETNKLWFPTEADAISAGYTLAANCQ